MKKLIYCMAALGALIFAASCAEDGLDVTGKTTEVTFTVAAPSSIQSKATFENGVSTIANGQNTDSLYYAIYGGEDFTKVLGKGDAKGSVSSEGNMTFTITLNLIIDQPYSIIFWAHESGAGEKYFDISDLTKVKIRNNYSGFEANDESRAAFYAHYDITPTVNATPQTVTLKRPFAQLNLGTTTLESSLTERIQVQKTTVKINNVQIANAFNTVDGVGEGDSNLTEVTFVAAPTPHGDQDNKTKEDGGQLLKVKNSTTGEYETYHWIGMNYLIAVGGQTDIVTSVVVDIQTNAGNVTHTVESVPLRQNYRTNLLGNFLTTGVDFNIVVDKLFESDIDENDDKKDDNMYI